MLPSSALVFVAGFASEGSGSPLDQWLAALGLLWLALLPMVVLGILIGLWGKAEAVQGSPRWSAAARHARRALAPGRGDAAGHADDAQVLSSYRLAELGRYPVLGGSFPWLGVLVLGLWSAALTGLGVLGYRRAVASSKR